METLQIAPHKIHFNFYGTQNVSYFAFRQHKAPLSSSPWCWCHLLNSRFRTIMLGHSVWRLKLLLSESCWPAPGPIFITSPLAGLGDISYCDGVQPLDHSPQNTIILLFSFFSEMISGPWQFVAVANKWLQEFFLSGRFLWNRGKEHPEFWNTSWQKTSTKSKRKDKRKSLSETTLAMLQKVSTCHQIAPDQTRLKIRGSFWEHLTLVLILNNPSSSLIYLQFHWIHSPK